uniref:DUF551 domain-containing protein n=1 Tax=Siphoviridae sp. ctKwY15 TaxID=2827843 RepID=A0A8S5SU56_9CAUD|nr:MAG TPA: Protein of unknown function (DUF551) [Siphoviridae sp. ctKwY15]
MDKKKVKELIQKAKHLAILRKYENRQTYLNNCICCLEDALKELSKSDWVSVEDGLPEYGEKVFAYDKEMQDFPFVTMRYKAGKEKLIDKNGFRSGLHVTHWKPIEKLEE